MMAKIMPGQLFNSAEAHWLIGKRGNYVATVAHEETTTGILVTMFMLLQRKKKWLYWILVDLSSFFSVLYVCISQYALIRLLPRAHQEAWCTSKTDLRLRGIFKSMAVIVLRA